MVSDKTSLRRHPERSVADDELIHRILDEGFLCHVGYLTEGRPVVIPTLYARDGARILLHGSPSSGIVRAVRKNPPLSVAVTHLDGLVVARSAFESSANYRSVVIHGFGEILKGKAHEDALNLITDHLIPGRRDDVRPNHTVEVCLTSAMRFGRTSSLRPGIRWSVIRLSASSSALPFSISPNPWMTTLR
jgi:nitroimidazol reductase NimA-like FMN-containing flavoprotein (pyridoxamine 5'-phosphate oxidase superfamily)